MDGVSPSDESDKDEVLLTWPVENRRFDRISRQRERETNDGASVQAFIYHDH